MNAKNNPKELAESLKRNMPKDNHAVSYCCEAASQIKPHEMPEELPFN